MSETISDSNARTVHRLLRCRRTRRYFCDGQWTRDPQRASVYSDPVEAAGACARHGLADVDLVLRQAGAQVELFATPLR